MVDLKFISKCGFAILIVISLAILVERLTEPDYSKNNDVPVVRELIINSTKTSAAENVDLGLDKNFAKCLNKHSKLLHFFVNNESLHVESNEHIRSCIHHQLSPEKCMYNFIIMFNKIMESLNIKLQLIEPSILFCLLPSAKRYNLISRGFSLKELIGSRNVITFGVSDMEAKILDELSTRKKIIYSGFRITKFPKKAEFMQKSKDKNATVETLHYFFKRHDLIIHMIVFYPRKAYLWHPGFVADVNSTGLLFVNDEAYDNFTSIPLILDNSMSQIYMPSDSRCFLLATGSSKFIECKSGFSNETSATNSISLNNDELKNQALSTLKVLKTVFGSQMVIFWLWSRTLLGWFEKCDILHYSPELEISMAVESVKGYNFTALFADSECQTIKQNFEISINPNIELNCNGMPVKISFMHEEKNLAWYEFQDGQNIDRQIFPDFEICSTDVLGLKINVPCNTNKIIETEFGQNWKNMLINYNLTNMKNL